MKGINLFLNGSRRLLAQLHITIPNRIRTVTLNTLDLIGSPRDQLVAPLRLRHVIGQDDDYDGQAFVQLLVENCGLKPNSAVLDVGCGCGRMALALTKQLNRNGSYDGFDIVKDFVDWCQTNVTPVYSNFHLQHANIYNKSYNPNGRTRAADYKFPYPDETFDIVFLSSVFTHMLPKDLENYLHEIVRVMKKNAKCLVTYFVLNAETQRQTDAKQSLVTFFEADGYFTTDRAVPENAVGYKEEHIQQLYDDVGLEIIQPIHYGDWSGRPSRTGYQDIIIATKTSCKLQTLVDLHENEREVPVERKVRRTL